MRYFAIAAFFSLVLAGCETNGQVTNGHLSEDSDRVQKANLALWRCLNSHCSDRAVGFSSDAEKPGVKEAIFDTCVQSLPKAIGDTEAGRKLDECMSKNGFYFQAEKE